MDGPYFDAKPGWNTTLALIEKALYEFWETFMKFQEKWLISWFSQKFKYFSIELTKLQFYFQTVSLEFGRILVFRYKRSKKSKMALDSLPSICF